MLALSLVRPSATDPLSAIEVAERDAPAVPDGWTTVEVRAASLNHHDVWSMRGVAVQDAWLPCVLGSDGAGVDADGNKVIVYPLIADPDAGGGDETLDPRRRMISDGIDGTFAERIAVPRRNLVANPPELSWDAAACLGTAWLTA
jgi:NADPH:quinone reductase-like Zn-dependent oxidoreductase